jgi:hypothetical protein
MAKSKKPPKKNPAAAPLDVPLDPKRVHELLSLYPT